MKIVAEAEDGVGAVEAARKHKPDVVLVDVTMPGMNGLEATLRITAESIGKTNALSAPRATRQNI